MTRSSPRTCAGGPCAITLPESSTTTQSQLLSTRPMSWSTSSTAVPELAMPGSSLPSSRLWRVSSPAAGSSRHSSRGRATSARPMPARLRSACDSSQGMASATASRPSSRSSPSTGAAPPPRAATVRFSRTLRSSNSSTVCHVRASPRLARACGGSPFRLAPPSRTSPWYRTKPVTASMKVVLPAPFGPMRPTSWPGSISRSTPVSARTPPKLTDTPRALNTEVIDAAGLPLGLINHLVKRTLTAATKAVNGTGQWRYGAVALRVVSQRASFGIIQMFNSRSGGIRQAASGANSAAETALLHSGGLLRLADCRHGAHSGRAHAGRAPPPVRGARDAVRVGDERDKQPDRADQQRPVAVQPEPAVERVRYQALGGAQAGEQRAADHRDPAEVRIGDDHQRVDRAEQVRADRLEVVCVQRAAYPGDQRAHHERGQLDPAHVDARRRGGPLVGPDGEHPLADRAPAEGRHEQAEQDQHHQHDDAEDRARHLAVDAAERRLRGQVEAEDAQRADRRPGGLRSPGRVAEAELLDR